MAHSFRERLLSHNFVGWTRHPAHTEAAKVRRPANALVHKLLIRREGVRILAVGADPAALIAEYRELRTEPLAARAGAFPVSAEAMVHYRTASPHSGQVLAFGPSFMTPPEW